MTELLMTIADAVRQADLRGHLRAWWEVVTGKVVTG